MKELRDFSKLNSIEFYALKNEIDLINEVSNINRVEKRKMEFMQKNFKIFENIQEMNKFLSIKPNKKRIIFRYLLSPIKIIGINDAVSGAIYQPNILKIKDGMQTAVKKPDSQIENIKSELFVKSVGFKSIKIDEIINFDQKKNIIPNIEGNVLDKGNHNVVVKGQYAAGWIKTGPKGTIANTFNDCEETISKIINDIKNGQLELKEAGKY